MTRHILLLRGVNVSGANTIKMVELSSFLSGLGFADVQTYIQSGNAVFTSSLSPEAAHELIAGEFQACFGFAPKMMLTSGAALAAALAGNPFAVRDFDPARLHAGFMAGEPDAEALSRVAAKARTSEEYQIKGRVFYLFTPDGLGTSKFAEGLERTLRVAVTFRNWRTVLALSAISDN